MNKFLIFISNYLMVLGVIFVINIFRLEKIRIEQGEEISRIKDMKIYNYEVIVKKLEESEELVSELSKENKGYRKIIEKWKLEQDRLNGDDWGI